MKRSYKILLIALPILFFAFIILRKQVIDNGARTSTILLDNPSAENLLVYLNEDSIPVPANTFVLYPVTKATRDLHDYHIRSINRKSNEVVADTTFSIKDSLSLYFINPSRSTYCIWRHEYQKTMSALRIGKNDVNIKETIELTSDSRYDNLPVITNAVLISCKEGYNPLHRVVEDSLTIGGTTKNIFFYNFVLRENDYEANYDVLLHISPFNKAKTKLKNLLSSFSTRLRKLGSPYAEKLRRSISVGPYDVKGFIDAVEIAKKSLPDKLDPDLREIRVALAHLEIHEHDTQAPEQVILQEAPVISWKQSWSNFFFPHSVLSPG